MGMYVFAFYWYYNDIILCEALRNTFRLAPYKHLFTSCIIYVFVGWQEEKKKEKKKGKILVCKPYDDGGMDMPDIFNFSSAIKIL